MKMNLKLVTFDIDLTQFLVNAETNEDAIRLAHKVNREIGMEDEDMAEFDVDEPNADWYSVDDVNFRLLGRICERGDWMFSHKDVIVYNG